jgi:hypothetical protein
MTEVKTGGPAFPINANESADRCIYTGMTLRDYFAAKAMKTYSNDTEELMLENAIHAYKQADAMLKAREL